MNEKESNKLELLNKILVKILYEKCNNLYYLNKDNLHAIMILDNIKQRFSGKLIQIANERDSHPFAKYDIGELSFYRLYNSIILRMDDIITEWFSEYINGNDQEVSFMNLCEINGTDVIYSDILRAFIYAIELD